MASGGAVVVMALRRETGSHPDAAHVRVRWIAIGGSKHLVPVCPCLLKDESVASVAVSLWETEMDADAVWFATMSKLAQLF